MVGTNWWSLGPRTAPITRHFCLLMLYTGNSGLSTGAAVAITFTVTFILTLTVTAIITFIVTYYVCVKRTLDKGNTQYS